jgi:hypothetical protein
MYRPMPQPGATPRRCQRPPRTESSPFTGLYGLVDNDMLSFVSCLVSARWRTESFRNERGIRQVRASTTKPICAPGYALSLRAHYHSTSKRTESDLGTAFPRNTARVYNASSPRRCE